MNLKSIIDKKDKYADYMIEDITHICNNLPKRDPGSEGEKLSCEYMGEIMKDLGCVDVKVEPFKENPGSFYGWIYFTITFCFIAFAAYFLNPIVSIICIILGLGICVLQFGLYKKFVDKVFNRDCLALSTTATWTYIINHTCVAANRLRS